VRITAQLIQVDTGANLWLTATTATSTISLSCRTTFPDASSERLLRKSDWPSNRASVALPPEALHAYDLASDPRICAGEVGIAMTAIWFKQAKELAARAVSADSASVPAYYALAEATSELAEMWNFRGDMDALLENRGGSGGDAAQPRSDKLCWLLSNWACGNTSTTGGRSPEQLTAGTRTQSQRLSNPAISRMGRIQCWTGQGCWGACRTRTARKSTRPAALPLLLGPRVCGAYHR